MAGGDILQDTPEKEVQIFDLDFSFPRRREQTSQNLLDSNHYVSSAREIIRKRKTIKKRNDVNQGYVHLVQAILRGESEDKLTQKIKDANGLETLLHLKLRIKDRAAQKSVSKHKNIL